MKAKELLVSAGSLLLAGLILVVAVSYTHLRAHET